MIVDQRRYVWNEEIGCSAGCRAWCALSQHLFCEKHLCKFCVFVQLFLKHYEPDLVSKYVVRYVNLNNDTRVYMFVKVWMVLFDKVSVGSVDVCSGCGVGDA